MMSVRTALKLGRVSNLPTVWTNVLAGMVLSGAEPSAGVVLSVGVAASLLYVAGMFLNDAFDHRWDAEHRIERPIPMGEVAARAVFRHKKNPAAPIVMGLCRVAVYVTAARAAAATIAPPLYVGAGFLLSYLVMLTLIARDETKDPKTPRLVGRLTAGVCLVDGLQILAFGSYWLAGICAVGFVLTLGLQRRVAGA